MKPFREFFRTLHLEGLSRTLAYLVTSCWSCWWPAKALGKFHTVFSATHSLGRPERWSGKVLWGGTWMMFGFPAWFTGCVCSSNFLDRSALRVGSRHLVRLVYDPLFFHSSLMLNVCHHQRFLNKNVKQDSLSCSHLFMWLSVKLVGINSWKEKYLHPGKVSWFLVVDEWPSTCGTTKSRVSCPESW